MPRLTNILVANRGEIAVRVMRTAKSLGYKTTAIYSEADVMMPHVAMADDALCIGPAPAAQSYLQGDAIIDAARQVGADAIHPGYGFLSENAEFAEACEDAGITFIGPPGHAVRQMGNKAEAKRHMIAAGIPCVPGYEGEDQSDDTLLAEAEDIGVPLMVKAAAGGGGRGMRLVTDFNDLVSMLDMARTEAQNAFGSDELILERAVLRPRHVEFQVFADNHGNVIHLGERDCSVQRRHQKVIEEAPCPVMTDDLRARMGACAVEAARSIGYRGAGTVEFLLDEDQNFYFLEMNTRLQVEHPVTELVTGLDLVAMQIAVAEGHTLPISQDEVTLTGHAIEVRLYAEEPERGFLPSTGHVDLWQPAQGDAIRVDSGIISGVDISPFYDPMVAKIITRGATRDAACRQAAKALKETTFFGPSSNRSFLIRCLESKSFLNGEATTAFICETFGEGAVPLLARDDRALAIGALLHVLCGFKDASTAALTVSPGLQNWSNMDGLESVVGLEIGEDIERVRVLPKDPQRYLAIVDDHDFTLIVEKFDDHQLQVSCNDQRVKVAYNRPAPYCIQLRMDDRDYVFHDRLATTQSAGDDETNGRIIAPMHGVILDIAVNVGDSVEKGDAICILEAMKMQHQIIAPIDGTVTTIAAAPESQIAADDLILEITAKEDA